MAKENTVLLYGYLEKPPVIHKKNDMADYVRLNLITLRRTYSNNLILNGPERLDTITVLIRNKDLLDKILTYQHKYSSLYSDDPLLHTMIFLRGTLSTKYVSRVLICPDCGTFYTKEHFLTYVDPINIHFWDIGNSDKLKSLQEKTELSNLVFMWGTLCRAPTIYPDIDTIKNSAEKLSKIECEFQIASNRKRKILEDTPLDTTDYPWVKVFGQKAISAYESLDIGSEVYIHGSLESRLVDNSHVCPNCLHVQTTHDRVMEIIPYELTDRDLENTALLYGMIHNKPKFQQDDHGNVTLIRFNLVTVRRFFDFRLNVFKQNRYDSPLVTITNPFLIKQFIAYMQSHPFDESKKTLLLVKGTVHTTDLKTAVTCPYCNTPYRKWTTRCFVEASSFFFWGESLDIKDALALLNDRSDISNILFLHGTLCGDPSLYPNTSLFVHPSQRMCEFQMESPRTRLSSIPDNPENDYLYPWVRVHGVKALDTVEALHTSSDVYIYGSIEAKKSLCYNTCPSCGKIFELEEPISEIVPYSIEYGNNCIKPEGVHGSLSDDLLFEEEVDS